jgi:arylformamidase
LDAFYEDFVYLDPEAAGYLAEKYVSLLAVDYFSIKQRGSSDNRPHTALLSAGIAILEGVNLKDVDPGTYELIALPLSLNGIDGSPCRAILRTQ